MIEFSKIKSSLLDIVELYSSKGIFNDSFKSEFASLFDKNALRIGVIGKMKAGKSTLVNALIFGDRILPTGDKPVTVTLTEITYDENEGVDVELMSENDISALRVLASSDTNDSKTSAARELITSIDAIPGGYAQHILNGIVSIPLSQLQDYVAADGKFSGLAKYVKIKLNNKNLQGITIVDTPGFNDPIKSRGEVTKNAIKDCQILLFVHDYFDRYDEEEVAMATEQIEYAGISEVIDIVNKTDQETDATLSDWDYLAEDYKNNRQEVLSTTSSVLQELIGNSPVLCVSALMSLLGRIEDNRFDDFDVKLYNNYRERYEELRCKENLHKFSNIPLVENEINRITRNSSRYLLETPLLKLTGELAAVSLSLQALIENKEGEYNMLNADSSEYASAVKEINHLIDSVMDALNETGPLSVELQNTINSTRDEIMFKRSDTIDKEFLDENFPEPGLGTTGIKKQNLSNYCTILLQMDGKIRVTLDSLKKSLVTAGNLYIANLIADTLTNTKVNVTEKNRERVESPLKSMIENEISRINLAVETSRPTSFPSGKLTQKTLYLNEFQTQYKDNRIQDDFIAVFQSQSDKIVSNLRFYGEKTLGELRETLVKGLNYTPSQKEKQKNDLKEEINTLHAHKNIIEDICSALKDITQVQQDLDKLTKESSDVAEAKSSHLQNLLASINTKLNEYDGVEIN